jgi:D-alanyl-D-alanine carboxypeptidase
VYEAYERLNQAISQDLDKRLLVLYGYRSPARQVFIFFDILERIYDFDFNKTMARVCFPDYSEHVCTQRQAIDFKTEDDISSDRFDSAQEYAWLKENAGQYGFFESYPKNNSLGMMYEPWHWHYEG